MHLVTGLKAHEISSKDLKKVPKSHVSIVNLKEAIYGRLKLDK
jgi:hypothetical protein